MTAVLERALDLATDSKRVQEINPLNEKFYNVSLLDIVNLSADTHYYPSISGFCQDGYRNLSVTGEFIDADGTVTLRCDCTNDDTDGVWITSIYGYNSAADEMTNTITVTNDTILFTLDFDALNYRYWRFVIINDGATNTCILKARLTAL